MTFSHLIYQSKEIRLNIPNFRLDPGVKVTASLPAGHKKSG
jgi:hypothetical protein